jgi:hypothetical protein
MLVRVVLKINTHIGDRKTRLHKALLWGPPALLCAVACVQIFLAMTKSLSPWKGGGFGMFSTVDSPDARFLRIYLINGDQETPVLVPDSLKTLGRKAQTIPSHELLTELGERMAQGTWVPYRFTDPVRSYQSNQARDDYTSALTGLTEPPIQSTDDSKDRAAHVVQSSPDGQLIFPNLLRMREQGEQAPANSDEVSFQRVRVELWKYKFEEAASQLKAAKFLEVTVDARH